MELQRLDLIFSYWILAWYLLYITKIITYSPKFIIILGIIENTILLFFMIENGSTIETIIKFIVINTIIKIVPYYTIRNDKIREKDILASVIIFIIYIIWLYINKETLLKKYDNIYKSLIQNKNDTPGMILLNFILKQIQNIQNKQY
jgi:hypothetical protein